MTERTLRHYRESHRAIQKYFDQRKMSSLTSEEAQRFINAYGQGEPPFSKPHAKETVDKLMVHVKAAIKQATKDDIFRVSPADDISSVWKNEPQSEKTKFLSEEDQIKLRRVVLNKLSSPVDYLILVGLDTGMRPGELLGLTWNNLDLKKNMVHVVQTWNYVEMKIDKVKMDRPCDVTITPALSKLLLSYREEQDSDFVFAASTGGPMSTSYLSRELKKRQEEANIDQKINPHGLRHSHASLMLYRGMDIKALSKRLGHKNIQITLNKYAHILDEMQAQQDKIVEETISKFYE